MKQLKIASISKDCVACGNCVKYCPRQAISVYHGICAIVMESLCVGCGKCEKVCPAGVITIIEKENTHE